MKKLLMYTGIILLMTMAPNGKVHAQYPISLVIQQGIIKVIKAIDLKIQRLQNKTIWLQNAQKVIENTMSKLKLGEISDWVEKQRVQYKNYFDELWKVKDMVAYYHRFQEIKDRQILLVREYSKAWNGVRQDHHFSPEEIIYIGKVYTGILEESLKNLEQIALVINSFTTQMTDAKRMEIINMAADGIQQNLNDLKAFNTQNIQLSLQRSKDAHDISIIKKLYGIR